MFSLSPDWVVEGRVVAAEGADVGVDAAAVGSAGVVDSAAVVVSAALVESACCGVGLALTGRSWWSVGFAGRSVSLEPGLTLTKVGEAVMTSWSSSSCSVGRGRSSWIEGSMHSPQRVSFQSVKLPLCSFTFVSFTTTLHLPTPVSPLKVD